MGDNFNALVVTGVVCIIYYLLSEPFHLSNFVRFSLGFSVVLVAYSLSIEFFKASSRKGEERLNE
jgi:hypothetical protein